MGLSTILTRRLAAALISSALALTEAQADRLRQGQPVLLTRDVPPSGALLRAEAGSRLVALVRSDGVALKPVRVFNL